jgi:hypothetical protein
MWMELADSELGRREEAMQFYTSCRDRNFHYSTEKSGGRKGKHHASRVPKGETSSCQGQLNGYALASTLGLYPEKKNTNFFPADNGYQGC